ncbi:class 1 fructose-bisphosphatase [soil metagenome]
MNNSNELGLPVGITLDRFIKRNQEDFPFASGELSQLLRDIALAGKIVNKEINLAGLNNISGMYGAQNVQGEDQQKLDVIANIRFIRALRNGGEVCAILSEEEKDIIKLENKSKYIVAIDPLDGSSNIDVNVSIGTIFSIYRRKTPTGTPVEEQDILQRGEEQVAAGYLLYGSSTMLVYTTGNGVNGFTYEYTLGEYFLSHHNITIPAEGKFYSTNDALFHSFPENVKSFIEYCRKQNYSARYIGSLVADFHRNMFKGGIFMYPPTDEVPKGKLRLMYECNALAFIIEQAGGKASDGTEDIMKIKPDSLHQRVPLFIGSKKMVQKLEEYLRT